MQDIAAIRGALDVAENSSEAILSAARRLLGEIFRLNGLGVQDVVAIFFTATADLNAVYPARAAREMGIGEAALMCMQEMAVPGSLERCLRVMVLCRAVHRNGGVKHVYLGGARSLRPDIVLDENDCEQKEELS